MAEDDYREICQVGEGAFGRVFKAIARDGSVVAIKQIKFESDEEGIPSTALREIALLKSLGGHPNIVPLRDIFYRPKEQMLKIVFDYYEFDLKRFLQSKEYVVEEKKVKHIFTQIVAAIAYCHSRKVLHRDLKPQNILLDPQAQQVRVADFGLARLLMTPGRTLTHQIETLWYRAPEILLGQLRYTYAVDIWALGCILAELYLCKPLFYGNGYEIGQIFKIFQMMGTPTFVQWPQLAQLPDYKGSFPRWNRKPLSPYLPHASPEALDLLHLLLQPNPERRISAQDALNHPFLHF